MSTVYVRLLGEGVEVYRPVPASQVESNIYVLGGAEIFDPEDEQWEFPPGEYVVAENKTLDGEVVLVAISKA
ncbi:hypothetical protein [Methylocaldum sp. RMAD-M]|uniref:hypothetical protein n=1 Tax=unclassified Methylocaldum TaxID=2622260 RepID=UPI001AE533FD|nr:hypothetical protein [Methylocaldum sp. RMAD-M]MBP1152574.1 hypothetical protein [Methylocaldum sp. RMAD-M]